jgi:DNA polymerase I
MVSLNLQELYKEVWFIDFEYSIDSEGRPVPICIVAVEGYNRKPKIRLLADELVYGVPPIIFDEQVLFVSYSAPAELGCFLVLGWSFPKHILDLYAEFFYIRNIISTEVPMHNKLNDALSSFNLPRVQDLKKKEMQDLSIRGAPFTEKEKRLLLDYCETDVVAIKRLLPVMLKDIPNWEAALFRGRYMAAVTRIQHIGIPIDVELFNRVMAVREKIVECLIQNASDKYKCFEGTKFKLNLFAKYLSDHEIDWPVTEKTGAPRTDMDTMRDMVIVYPEVEELATALRSKKELNKISLEVFSDGYSRPVLFPFGSNTGRNQPRAFIFAMSAWIRSFIQPKLGMAIAYVDWTAQEIAVAAGLSKDPVMIAAYNAGDPHINFAIQVGAAPVGATKDSHEDIRNKYKSTNLAVMYGKGAQKLSIDLGVPVCDAEDLLESHHELYVKFWEWSDESVRRANLFGEIFTPLGWRMLVRPESEQWAGKRGAKNGRKRSNHRTLLNWPMQAGGGDMMRLAACLATEDGLQICCPVHDAFLLQSPIETIEKDVERLQKHMDTASKFIFQNALVVRSDVKIILHPNRYEDKRGKKTWKTVMEELVRLEKENNL